MAQKALGSKEIAIGQQMRREGLTDKAIAQQLGVNERTLRRSMGRRRDLLRQPVPEADESGWGRERYLPDDWSVEVIEARTGVSQDLASRIASAGNRAHQRGDKWLEWFLRCWVERSDDTDAPEPWVTLLAGLPVLAEWLSEPACNEIHRLILQYRPYLVEAKLDGANRLVNANPDPSDQQARSRESIVEEYRRVRQGISSASRGHLGALRGHIESMSYSGLIELPDGGDIPYSALKEITSRLPMIGTDPNDDIFGRSNWTYRDSVTDLWQLFAQVFIHKPARREDVSS